MSSTRKAENWLLVEWSSGGRDVVYVKSVLSPLNKELKIGDELTVNRRGDPDTGILIARAKERALLDSMLKDETAGPSTKNEEEVGDYSSGASSWVPSDGEQSGDSEVDSKKPTLHRCKRQYSNRRSSKKIMTPSHRPTPVIPKIMQKANQLKRKRTINDDNGYNQSISNNNTINKSIPDSTKRSIIQNEVSNQKVSIDVRELMELNDTFQTLFQMLEELKQPLTQGLNQVVDKSYPDITIPTAPEDTTQFNQSDEDKENDLSENFDRSDDNILISNKYTNVTTAKNNGDDKEWVPIGSGKTLIHVDQFKKVNWRSYTIATRTLLLSVFPKRILATHSLTGKRSPAFQDKPAKMCLDPKIISDVIIEIMDRFNVRENLVRSIITTKCADEAKMWKTRVNKKNSNKTIKNESLPVKVQDVSFQS